MSGNSLERKDQRHEEMLEVTHSPWKDTKVLNKDDGDGDGGLDSRDKWNLAISWI